MKILIATGNKGKANEFRSLLADDRFELMDLGHFPPGAEIAETGSTFAENSVLKAAGYARRFGLHTLADDSGLEVAALGGRPGVYSARYAGGNTDYDTKIQTLLAEMENSGSISREARFVSHIAFASPDGEALFEAEGVCSGAIARRPRGTNGFGYDPIFVPDGFEKTFGELEDDLKNEISHRARAAAKIIRYLLDFA